MDGLSTILRLTANLMPWEAVIEKLEESIEDFKNAKIPSEKEHAKIALSMSSMLVNYKLADEKSNRDIKQIIEDDRLVHEAVSIAEGIKKKDFN